MRSSTRLTAIESRLSVIPPAGIWQPCWVRPTKTMGWNPSARTALEQYSSRVGAVIAGGAPCEFDWIKDDAKTLVYWLGARKCDDPEIYQKASPLTYVSPDDPPFYFYHGEFDAVVPKQTSCKLHDRLVECDVDSRHDVALNLGHVLTFSDLSWMTRAIRFLDIHLKREPDLEPSSLSDEPGD